MTEENRPRVRDLFRMRTVSGEVEQSLPSGLRIATAYAWRLLIIAAAIGVVIWLVIQLKYLVIPLLIGLLIAALLWPAFEALQRRRVPKWLAIVIVVVGTIAIVAGLLWLVIWQIVQQADDVRTRTVQALDEFQNFLVTGPLQLSAEEIQGYIEQGLALLQEQAQLLWSGALAIGSTFGHVVTGGLLALFILLCILADGAGIWRWTVRLFPRDARPAIDSAARNGWRTVVNYARTQMLVATIDAVGIGLGAFLLGVPLAIPVAVLVFLGSFVPIVGAVLTGTLAVFLALVYNGPWIALWMLVVVLGVQQLEGHVLQPILMGSAVKVHPLAVVLVVAGGAMIAGIPGALFAVPLAAFVNVVAVTLSSGAWRTGAPPPGDLIWSTVPRTRKDAR
ncbi:putative PurR-regulated permease PerM [Microbacterium keratanolyticum]|uniref:AI-2E family transporter n=1 Tax=Microbacterium keratanolyticum TaxID=67574 RepID=UPI00195E0BF2|nr:AI-2E family transporter [Microbacterium keratanolyticum]MBM7469822.1 putative PurR-regulated permease PerM [Microbacterium keratanolyticum]